MDGSCTPMRTNQCDTPHCKYHTFPKMIIKNVFEVVLDLSLTPEENEQYKKCMENPLTSRNRSYSLDCSEMGFIKIMLFYYLYDLCTMIGNDYENLDFMLTMPTSKKEINTFLRSRRLRVGKSIKVLDQSIFDEVKAEFLKKKSKFEWVYFSMSLDSTKDSDEETFRSGIIHTLLTSVIDLKLYIELGLETVPESTTESESDSESESVVKESTPHIVLITGYEHVDESVNISIKNSWGELSNKVNDYKLESIIDLDGEQFNQITMYFLLPMLISNPVDDFTFKEAYSFNEDLTPLFDFIGDYHREYSDLFKRKGGTRRNRKRRSKTMNRKRIT